MTIIIDNHIPHIQGLIEPYAEVLYLEPGDITREVVREADALVVRTRTRCNADLLNGSRVRFIGSATIGTDHIDLDYCAQHGITVRNAPGCNAPAVAQWVFCAINAWMRHRGIATPSGLTLGIVGVGHIGSIVARWASRLGFDVMLNDPPRQSMDDNAKNDEIVSYLEQDPYLVNIYEGYGFAKDYGSARGHAYTLEDVHNTERPHATANCLTCKTPNFAKLVQDKGVEVYTYDFDEVWNQIHDMGEVVSCYTCHGNSAGNDGELRVTHTYVNKALGSNVQTIDPATLSCGQCHIEY